MVNPNLLLAQIEARHLWAYFHKDWIVEIRRLLRPQLPDNYYVFIESETVLVSPDGLEVAAKSSPDVAITQAEHPGGLVSNEPEGATVAVVDLEESVEIFNKYSLVIRRSPDQQLIAALEIVSPSNKGLGNQLDRDKYLRKREGYLEAGISFLEVDALLNGERLFPRALNHLGDFRRNAWTAFLHGSQRRLRGYGWSEQDTMPKVPWRIDDTQAVLVDLGAAATDALSFNRWESLARPRTE